MVCGAANVKNGKTAFLRSIGAASNVMMLGAENAKELCDLYIDH